MDVKTILKRTISVLLTMLVLCCTFALQGFAEPGDPAWDQKVKEVIKEAQRKKEEREKERIKAGRAQVDPPLLELEAAYEKGGLEEAKKIGGKRGLTINDNNKITVYIRLKLGISVEQFDKLTFQTYGGEIIDASTWGAHAEIVACIPIGMIKKISELRDIENIVIPGGLSLESYNSEGVSLTGAQSYLDSRITGTHIKVAVIDGGFNNLSSAISSGDLPSNAIKIDCTSASCFSSIFSSETATHGTAVSEIVYDMARDAQVYLIKIDRDKASLKRAITYCKDNGIKIINHSIGWYNQNFYDGACYNDNAVCSANDANNNGILFVKSAGNSAQRHYYATYSDPNHQGWHDPVPTIESEEDDTITIDFTWDAWPSTDQDFNIYLMYYDSQGNTSFCASGERGQTGIETPTESLSCYADATRTYYILISDYAAMTNPIFHIFSSHDINPSVAARSLTSPADASGAFAVGAIHMEFMADGSSRGLQLSRADERR